jgi:hypothetical protein
MPLWSNLIKRLYNDTSVCILPGKDSNYSTASLKAQTEPNCPWISPTSPQRIFPLLCIVQRIRITRFVSLRGSKFHPLLCLISVHFCNVVVRKQTPKKQPQIRRVSKIQSLSVKRKPKLQMAFCSVKQISPALRSGPCGTFRLTPHPKANFSPGPGTVATCETLYNCPILLIVKTSFLS